MSVWLRVLLRTSSNITMPEDFSSSMLLLLAWSLRVVDDMAKQGRKRSAADQLAS